MEETVALKFSRHKSPQRYFWAAAGAGLLLFAIVTIPSGARENRALSFNLQRAARIREGLEYKESMLAQCERALKTDPFFNEVALREKMKYRKPGEQVLAGGESASMLAKARDYKVPEFVPIRQGATTTRQQVTQWALLLSSGLLMGAAFLFFDGEPKLRPGRG